jgi:hypothetical protein
VPEKKFLTFILFFYIVAKSCKGGTQKMNQNGHKAEGSYHAGATITMLQAG